MNGLVVSASRRTDLVGCYPGEFIGRLKNYPPEKVHTLVIWTKNPLPLLDNKHLRKKIASYRQIYIHLTVTGMAGSIFEPGIPPAQTVVRRLPELAVLAGSPARICWRFDPIVHLTDGKKQYSNLSFFKELSGQFAAQGIHQVKTSWLCLYRKVERNLEKIGWQAEEPSLRQKKQEAEKLKKIAQKFGQEIQFCSVPGFPKSRCIDGPLFNSLHPDGSVCPVRKAKGQRKECNCTESIDIGWYSQTCGHGCVYCYANPLVR